MLKTRSRVRVLLLVLPSLILAACTPVERPQLPTRTPIPTNTPTATVEWFPPTSTPAILPTVEASATPDSRAGLGPLILEDDFSEPNQWSLTASETRSAAIANGHLTLALSGDKDTLYSLRFTPILGNFYAEVLVQPNLCSGMDEYGIIFRATPDFDHFRYGISCNGQAHIDRIYKLAARAFAPWERFGALPGVAPSSVRLAVRADGSSVSVYANDQQLFTITDSQFYQGSFGLYVRTEGNSPISVNFSDLTVYSLP